MDRKLASIQVVSNIEPIYDKEGNLAQKIERATVLGWSAVVPKGKMKPGDKCIYIEIDAQLPYTPEFQFLGTEDKFPWRLKTVKFLGTLSQGLVLPISDVPNCTGSSIGSDITELLGITKYEPIFSDGSDSLGPFPGYVPHTNEVRIQSVPEVLVEMRGHLVYVTTKLNGTSSTYLWGRDGEFLSCSHHNAKKPDSIWGKISEKYSLPEKLRGTTYAIQGEVCGPGIMKNRLGLKDHQLFIFDVYDYSTGTYLTFNEMVEVVSSIELVTVPIEQVNLPLMYTLDELLVMASGIYSGTDNRKEGIVVRSMSNATCLALDNSRLSFKVINNEYLLRGGE